ncbi:translesion DNA synthesis-associated protein ImuA [Chitiniphilus eburneus]|uniref:Translesion DNA synthesis-associated protein ImuA n=1 Tax=Chitiniphilus eburneus TaxID=2571148 RepID=A0A4U0PUI8_9NEIS|nr:translesion DNA synthesis-associated protein ImuA [Chitiniphilus eburneus]TJZ72085.1 translesion DNA synthesis-associated protein ImuA [Chitiniphilus eburneus]
MSRPPDSPHTLQQAIRQGAVWRGDRCPPITARPSGYPALDAQLPGGGWGLGQINELLHRPGQGELALLLPALRRVAEEGRPILLVAPPWIPYAPAWAQAGIPLAQLVWIRATAADALWALEQALAEPDCGAVLGWAGPRLDDRHARRLQLAARRGGGLGLLLRHGAPESVASPFPLRLAVAAQGDGWRVRLLKRRGPPLSEPLYLTQPDSSFRPRPESPLPCHAGLLEFDATPRRRAA